MERKTKTIEELISIMAEDYEYRKDLLQKFSVILQQSDARVDNVNHMTNNLIEQQRLCSERVDKLARLIEREQDNEKMILEAVERKEQRIQELEKELRISRERYDSLLERILTQKNAVNENNFHLAK